MVEAVSNSLDLSAPAQDDLCIVVGYLFLCTFSELSCWTRRRFRNYDMTPTTPIL